MATSLTGQKIKLTYQQLLHIDGGLSATEGFVRTAVGTASILKLGTDSASISNIRFSASGITAASGSYNITGAAISNCTISSITDLAVADGGTGASSASGARTNLGLGSIATQNANAVAIIGGSITALTELDTDDIAADTGSITALTVSTLAATSVDSDSASVDDVTTDTVTSLTTNGDLTLAGNGTGKVVSSSPFGYKTGVGGTVTQLTSKATGVTLNKLSGQITTHNATLNHETAVAFTLTNSYIAATDVVIVNIASGATSGVYSVGVEAVDPGSCGIVIHNHTPATDLGEAIVINFVVIKGVSS